MSISHDLALNALSELFQAHELAATAMNIMTPEQRDLVVASMQWGTRHYEREAVILQLQQALKGCAA